MLDNPPRESEVRSWAWLLLGVAIVYATIPVARALRNLVDREFGGEIFIYVCLAGVVAGGTWAWRSLRRRQMPRGAYLWLSLVLCLFAVGIYDLRRIPEEALHVAEYAVLGLLAYRALVHRIRDYSIYPIAALLVGMIGVIDEYIQWVVPTRYFDVGDIRINFIAGLLTQIGIVAGLRPRLVSGWPDARAWGRVSFCTATALALLLIAFVNTPPRVTWYAQALPGLEFLLDGNSMMAQYGYRHRSPVGGEFRSRFDAETLVELDAQRGDDVAAILDRYIRGEGYARFLAIHSIIRDPYAHEAGVHLFRREFHLDRARDPERDSADHYTIAFHENEILKAFFSTAIGTSSHRWGVAVEAEVSAGARKNEAYLSAVSSAIITQLSEREVITLFVIAIVLSLGAGAWLTRRP